ncbi:triple tyrosine motif-containing protein [Pontibacter sp. 13R65]|uniref:triple tyrosine motif-containing protein n=1 Tax=Pontibacter sp. 13R65 TaxID=3127458 RepID=UPI00301E37D9
MFKKILLALTVVMLVGFGAMGETKASVDLGFPFVQNYTKQLYNAGNQNWSLCQGADGVMYFGNSEGLMVFDGEHWQLYRMPNRIIVRSVAADTTGKVFVGGYAEFGYWANDKNGRFTYQSLTHLLPDTNELRNEVWKIYVDGDKVYFQSFSAIYLYQHGKVKLIKGEQAFLFLLKARNRFFVEGIGAGLFEVKGDLLSPLPNSEALGETGVLTILPYKEDQFLIGTAKDGLFIYDGQEFTPWVTEADYLLKTSQLNNGAMVQGKYFAFGTILNGVIILDEEGKIVQHVNKLKGLQNNTVLNLYTDRMQNLWTGLDNGIDRIEVNSPLFYYFDKSGKFGTVYSSIIHDNKIYIGTNQGLFYSDWSASKNRSLDPFDFKLIENSQGQVWDLSLVGGQLICGHNAGSFRVVGNSIQKISDVNGGWVMQRLSSNPDLLLQGTYTGLVVYKRDENGNWNFSHKVADFSEPSRYVEEDNTGYIWVSHNYRGLYKLTLSNDFKIVKASRKYDQKDGLPGNYNINVFKLENRIVFSSDSGFYVYDEISDKLLKYNQLNNKLGSFATSGSVIRANTKKYWLIDHGKVALADFTEPGKVKVNSSQFHMLSGHMVQFYENISRISNSMYLISIDDGFVVYNAAVQQPNRTALPAVVIRKVENTTSRLTTIADTGKPGNELEIPYNRNNIRITYALPYYSQGKARYQYQLEGYSDGWSEWSADAQKDFTNLDKGNYKFLVRAKIGEEAISPVTVFRFTVLPPWYASAWAITFYLVFTLVLLFLLRQLYQQKLKRDQQRILEKLEQEKQEFLQQEALANEQKIVKLKNEQLKTELAAKSRELANSALNIVSKNEMLQSLRDEINQLKDAAGKKVPDDQLKKIQKIIDDGMGNERDWDLFESSFNETHENYFKKLKSRYPELTPNDLKFCAYLRMNMSSKEIASLLNITVRGVEIRRYRLRKRLNMEHEKNLVEFLMEI